MASRPRTFLALSAIAVLVVAGAAWRSLDDPAGRRALLPAPAPNPQLAHLMRFARPLADSLRAGAPEPERITLARDPFVALPKPAGVRLAADEPQLKPQKIDAAEWDVTATLIAGARRAALINGVLVSVGDTAPGGATLTAVERDRVVLTDQRGGAHTIAVKEGER